MSDDDPSEASSVDRSIRFEDLPMRVGAGQFMAPTEQRLRYVEQLGCDDVLLNMYAVDDPEYEHMPDGESPPLSAELPWSVEELRALRERVEDAGLRLNAIENVPVAAYEDVMLGGPEREAQLEALQQTIQKMGEAGIPTLGYHWAPAGVWRTGRTTTRGGASVSAFDADDLDDELTHGREYSEAELWEHYETFLESVLPVAEAAGVQLCAHPSDPPMERLGGVPQILRSFESFQRAMDLVPSDNHGLELCLGCWSEMGAPLEEVIRYFGERDEICYVHFRDVEGTVPSFSEAFVDEGNFEEWHVLQLLEEVGFSGMLIPDHTPHLEDDTDWEHRGRAYTIGYLRGMTKTLRETETVRETDAA